jgi:hypothetical protein
MKNVFKNYLFLSFIMTGMLLSPSCNPPTKEANAQANAVDSFDGVIALDIRDSKPDWKPYTPKSAPEGAPNILFVLYDDTGLGAWSPYGGRINMPTLDKLAANGLTYTQWAYHGFMLTHPFYHPYRKKPPFEWNGIYYRNCRWISWFQWSCA